MIQVWSRLRPAVVRTIDGGYVVAAGTIEKMVYQGLEIPTNSRVSLSTNIEWMNAPVPVSKRFTMRPVLGRPYMVKVFEDGRQECSCPGFHYRRQCKHTK